MTTLGRFFDLKAPDGRRDHIHLVAVLYVAATVMLLVGAMSSQNNLLFATVGLALASVIVSGFIAGSSMMGLLFARRVPVYAEAEKPLHLLYVIQNNNKVISAFAIRVVDVAAGPNSQNIPVRAGVDRVAPGAMRDVSAHVSLPTRGKWVFGPGRLYTMFPFGISKKSMRFNHTDFLLVMPATKEMLPGMLGALDSVGDDGRSDLRRKGTGAELFSLRDYQRGDPVSSIAWQASARWGSLISRDSAAPVSRKVWIVIEASQSSLQKREPEAEAAVRLALAAGRRLQEAGVAAGLSVPSCCVHVVPDHVNAATPGWAPLLATLGDEMPKTQTPKSIDQADGIVAIGSGMTPGSTVVLQPTKESAYITAPVEVQL